MIVSTKNKNVWVEIIHITITTNENNGIIIRIKVQSFYDLMREEESASIVISILMTYWLAMVTLQDLTTLFDLHCKYISTPLIEYILWVSSNII